MENELVAALVARVAVLEGAVTALLRMHPIPDMARDEIRMAADLALDTALDSDAPCAQAADAAAETARALCDALTC